MSQKAFFSERSGTSNKGLDFSSELIQNSLSPQKKNMKFLKSSTFRPQDCNENSTFRPSKPSKPISLSHSAARATARCPRRAAVTSNVTWRLPVWVPARNHVKVHSLWRLRWMLFQASSPGAATKSTRMICAQKQLQDFAKIIPIVEAVYKQSHLKVGLKVV